MPLPVLSPPGIRPTIREQDPLRSSMEQFEWILAFVKWKHCLNGDLKMSPDDQLAKLLNVSCMTLVRTRKDMRIILDGGSVPLPAIPLVMYLASLCGPSLEDNLTEYRRFKQWYDQLDRLYKRACEIQQIQHGRITEQRAIAEKGRKQRDTTGELPRLLTRQ